QGEGLLLSKQKTALEHSSAVHFVSQSSGSAEPEKSSIVFLLAPPVKKLFSACQCVRQDARSRLQAPQNWKPSEAGSNFLRGE
ncbi:MAG: hypothetical protein IJO69_04395, partial [Ruminiclostridium sp.]|nr:hypothetical protein [Ruminiclostridium sp.]